jgi:hypothetical protein
MHACVHTKYIELSLTAVRGGTHAQATLPGDGAAQTLVTLEACSINQPHVHPRATEVAFITEGELFFGFHEENGGRFVSSTIGVGQTFVIPQGYGYLLAMPWQLDCSQLRGSDRCFSACMPVWPSWPCRLRPATRSHNKRFSLYSRRQPVIGVQ